METNENITEMYLSKLKTSVNVGVTLAQFYAAMNGAVITKSEIIMINRLVKIFGKMSVFFAIIDASKKEDLKEFPYGLMYKICKDRLERTSDTELALSAMYGLDKKINELYKEMQRVKEIDPAIHHKIFSEGL